MVYLQTSADTLQMCITQKDLWSICLRPSDNAALSIHHVMTQIGPCSSAQMVAPLAAYPLKLIIVSNSMPDAVSKAVLMITDQGLCTVQARTCIPLLHLSAFPSEMHATSNTLVVYPFALPHTQPRPASTHLVCKSALQEQLCNSALQTLLFAVTQLVGIPGQGSEPSHL